MKSWRVGTFFAQARQFLKIFKTFFAQAWKLLKILKLFLWKSGRIGTFFNQDSLQAQLVSRYLYEHLYLANLYFYDEKADTQFYKLVRSYSPPGSPIRVIPSRRPFDDPGANVFM